MNVIALDTEVTTSNKGDPFDVRNKFVLGGWYDGSDYTNLQVQTYFLHQMDHL